MAQYTSNLHPQDTPADVINPNIVNDNIPAESITSDKLTQQAQGHFNTVWQKAFTAININTETQQVEVDIQTNVNVISSNGVSNNTGKSGNYSFAAANTFLWIFAYDLAAKDFVIIDFDAGETAFGENIYPLFGFSDNMGGRVSFFAGISPEFITINNKPIFSKIQETDVNVGGELYILGDSFSTFRGFVTGNNAVWYPRKENNVQNVAETWWRKIAAIYGLKIYENNSYSGSLICNYGNLSKFSFINRIKDLPTKGYPPFIIILGGTNDVWSNAPIGEIKYSNFSKDDLKTYSPAVAYLLNYITTNAPNANIIYLIPPAVTGEYYNNTVEICEHFSVFYIDIPNTIEMQSQHPDKLGMQQIANTIIKKVLDL